jgi:hypothetical protein
MIISPAAGILRTPQPGEKNRTGDSADDTIFFDFEEIMHSSSLDHTVLSHVDTLPWKYLLSWFLFFPS